MRYSRLIAAAIIVSMVLASLPAQQANAAQPYSEKFTGYMAGSNVLWFMSFGGVNATAPPIAAVEAIQGVNSYNLTAVQTTAWSSDYQIFGPNGYNLIPVPFVPTQGAFLTISATSASDAASAVSQFNSYFLTSFAPLSNGTGTFSYYAPLSFGDIVPSTLLRLFPARMGGFASALNPLAFANLQSPIVELSGQRGGSGFSHVLTVGSISAGALTSGSQPNILKYFGTSITSIRASNKSTSSVIDFHFLDGRVNSSDHAAVSTSTALSGTYALTLTPGAKVKNLNVTVVQQPPQLLANRFLDAGVLRQGQNVSVSIALTNLSNSTTLSNIKLSDDWWKGYGFFKLVNGNSTIDVSTLSGGKTTTPTYVLQYTGTATQQISIPAASIGYSYNIGTASFRGSAALNPALIYLGSDEPAVFAYVVPVSGFGQPVGSSQQFRITAKNVGSRAASSVVIAGQSVGGLSADGGTATATVSLSASTLLSTNASKLYTVSYSTPEGQTVNVVTNPAQVVFSHSSMNLGFAPLSETVAVSAPNGAGTTNVTLTFKVTNTGKANVTSFSAEGALPAGLSCGTIGGSGLTCSSGHLALSYGNLALKAAKNASMVFSLSTPANYIFSPLTYSWSTSGFNLTAESNSVAAPSGFTLAKQFSPSQFFPGMTSTVTVNGKNMGPFAVYNTTVQSAQDSFDTLGSTVVPIKFSQTVPPAGNVTFTYSVKARNSTFGNITSSPVVARVYYGGAPYILRVSGPVVAVYQPVGVTIQTTPSSPIEGRAFSIQVTVSNPSGVTVSNVQFSMPIPSGMALSDIQNAGFSGGTLSMSTDQLTPHASFTANMTAQASSGLTVLFSQGKLTFQYSGVTLGGAIPNKDIVVGEDVLTRYTLPTLLVLVALLATAFYVRRMAGSSVPAPQK